VLAQSLPDLERALPESVRSMIERKIDQLEEEDRRLLVAASVQGYEFDTAVVAKTLTLDTAEVEEQLERLERIHAFVRLVREYEFPDRTLTLQYRFVHVLYQNALYASLRPTRRASLSAAVAQALLGYYGEKNAAVAAELALLLEAARDYARAAEYFLLAAQNAVRLFANQEAVGLARRGLEMLKTLPDTPERPQQELTLLITLGPPLIATKGWTAPEVETIYTRAHALCRRVGETPQLFQALWGLWFFHAIVRTDMQTALNLGQQLLSLAQRTQDTGLLVQAYHALGPTYWQRGDWASAQAYLEQGIALYNSQQHRSHASLYGGHDPGVCCLCLAAWCRWMLGYPDQALRRSQEALALARELSDPASLAHAQFFVGMLHQFRRDASATEQLAEALERLSTEQGFPFHLAAALVLRGWALAERGQGEEGLTHIRQGMAIWPPGALSWRCYFLSLLAEVYGKADKYEDGLAALAEALRAIEDNGLRWYEPEMHRLQGVLLLAGAPDSPGDAEACFRQAIALGRHQGAKSWELRAVMSLSRLLHHQGQTAEARQILAEAYGWFTEGFDTVDLREAKALLQAVS